MSTRKRRSAARSDPRLRTLREAPQPLSAIEAAAKARADAFEALSRLALRAEPASVIAAARIDAQEAAERFEAIRAAAFAEGRFR